MTHGRARQLTGEVGAAPKSCEPAWRRAVSLLLLSGLLASCVPPARSRPGPPEPPPASRRVADRLYFGRSIARGGAVSDESWEAFLREVVTPLFPDGLTAWPARGQWRDSSGGIVREESFLLEIIHPPDERSDHAIRRIVEEYRKRFHQESVLRVADTVHVEF